MAAGDVKIAYAASSNLTVTALHSIATSSTFSAGWESALIDNSTNKYLDYLVTAKITVGTTLTAGEIRVHVVAMLDDSTWPDNMDGTESVDSFSDTEQYDALARVGAVSATDTDNSNVYYMGPFSVASLFGSVCPEKFVIFVSHNTGANLASSGNQVTIKPVYQTVAAA